MEGRRSNQDENLKLDMQDIEDAHCNNLISLMKETKDFKLKIAICVCVYNEDKFMLKRTLSGIAENIKTFCKNGVHYNEIGVFVIIDGI